MPPSLPLCSVRLGPEAGKLLFPRVPYELGSTSNLVGDWKETSILVLTLTGAGAVVVAVATAAMKCVPSWSAAAGVKQDVCASRTDRTKASTAQQELASGF